MARRMSRGLALAALVTAACGGDSSSPSAPSAPPATPAPQATPTAATARYRVTFESTWTSSTHPGDFPSNPHFSALVGGTHSSRARFWMADGAASPGIEKMAEEGRTSPLDAEVQAAIAEGAAFSLIRGGSIARSPGSATAEFEIARDHPLVTLVSMVAPSPDWFVGVDSLSLVAGGDWVAERVVTLYAWDAGTDSGTSYASADADTQPRERIRVLEGHPVATPAGVAAFGRFSFRRVN